MTSVSSRIIACLLAALSYLPVHASTVTATDVGPVIKRVAAGVVSIMVEKKNSGGFNSGPRPTPSADMKAVAIGSGVIIDAAKGLVVTNAHVIDQAKTIIVKIHNGRRYVAHVIGQDNGFDIAIVKIPAHHLTALNFADSDNLSVGNPVIAIGSPFGLNQTVTSGVISALNVSQPKIEGFQSFIQTDASINPGNSGGALINTQGNVVGINTAIFGPGANIGIGFAIPSDMVQSVVNQLLKYGKVERSMLGVVAQNITPELQQAMQLRNTKGTLVAKVIPGSPANLAGIKVEDVIATINGKAIHSAVQLRNTLGMLHPGTDVKITVNRNNQPHKLTATVIDPNKLMVRNTMPCLMGVKIENYKELQQDGTVATGALVTALTETAPANLAGLAPGDIITAANHHVIHSVDDLMRASHQSPRSLLVKVDRGNLSAYMVIENPHS